MTKCVRCHNEYPDSFMRQRAYIRFKVKTPIKRHREIAIGRICYLCLMEVTTKEVTTKNDAARTR